MKPSLRLLFSSAVALSICMLFACTAGNYGATCLEPAPIEICGNHIDDDCNGIVDDGCTCDFDTTRDCYPDQDGNAMPAPINLSDKAGCKKGVQACTDGNWDNHCEGGTPPAGEICGNDIDEDCDGQIDDPDACQCVSGSTRDCWVTAAGAISPTPPASHDNPFSRCKKGTQLCTNGAWAGNRCVDASGTNSVAGPVTEVLDCIDNNCDGRVDEGLLTACKNAQNGCWGVYQCSATTLSCAVAMGMPDATGWHATSNTLNGDWDWNCSGFIEVNYCPATGCGATPPDYFINTKDPNQACAAIFASTGLCPTTDVSYNLASPTVPACGAAIPATKCIAAAAPMNCIQATPAVVDNWKVFCR